MNLDSSYLYRRYMYGVCTARTACLQISTAQMYICFSESDMAQVLAYSSTDFYADLFERSTYFFVCMDN